MPEAKRSQVAQCLKHIHGIADVVKENVIELLARIENVPEVLFIRERDCEFERRVALSCDLHDLGTNVDAFPFNRRDGSEFVAGAATNRQHLLMWLDQESKKPAQEFVIISIALYPDVATRRNGCQMLASAFASLLQRGRSPDFLVCFALVYYSFHLAKSASSGTQSSLRWESPRTFGLQNFL